MAKILLIVNPNAGKRRGLQAAYDAAEELNRHGHEVTTKISNFPGDTVILAKELITEGGRDHGIDIVVAVGGDGTLFEVVNGLFAGMREAATEPPESTTHDTLPTVAQIPVGTGNSFLKDVGIETAGEAVNAILAGETRRVDVGKYRNDDGVWHFINLLGAGFVSSVAHRARRYKRLGALSYVIAVVVETVRLSSASITLTIDDRRLVRDGVFVEICNSRYTGGDMMMAPDASIDDGFFDVVVMSRVTRSRLLSLFPKIFSGRHVEDPLIEVFRCRSITVETDRVWLLTPDGETFGTTPIHVEMIRRGLNFVVAPESSDT